MARDQIIIFTSVVAGVGGTRCRGHKSLCWWWLSGEGEG